MDYMKDLEIDDLIDDMGKKKKVNGKRKGNRVELELCKKLTKHFGREFSRSVGSGNRWSQVSNMPAHAKSTLTGDICVPEGFRWVVECKGGYDDDVDFSSVLDGGCARLDEFIEQSNHDAEQSGRKPIICWKRSRKPWIALIRTTDNPANFEYSTHYRDWIIVALDELLKTENLIWFDQT